MQPLQLSFRLAQHSEITKLGEILSACKMHLLSNGILQWDDNYPNEDFLVDKVSDQELYVLENEAGIIGAFVIDEWQSPEWADVQWGHNGGSYLVLHSLFIHPDRQGCGGGTAVLAYIEEVAVRNKYNAIRLDVFSKNPAALKLYEKHGYSKRGEVTFPFKPVNNQIYYCYDKIIG